MIETLLDEDKEAGTYEVGFDTSICHSGERRNLSEGTYIYQLPAEDYLSTKRMNLRVCGVSDLFPTGLSKK